MLNLIWAGFFIAAFIMAVLASFNGNTAIWSDMVNGLFTSVDTAFKTSLNLTGVLCFWLGMLKIAEKSGLTELLARGLKPFFRAIMPDLKKDSPAFSAIVMNVAANVLGLDNAATPMGLKAMEEMQKENKTPDKASNAQIMFMVLNSSALTILPITILMYRFQFGSMAPAKVFIPILLATACSTLTGFIATALWQRINIFRRVILAYLLIGVGFIGTIGYIFGNNANSTQMTVILSNAILAGLVVLFIVAGLIKKQNVYENFIEGAKDGFHIAVQIIPYLVAMLAAIGVFRATGGIDLFCEKLAELLHYFGYDAEFTKALPAALMKPLSGSGARAMMIDIFSTYGVDSFAGFAASIVQGSTETTFYVLAVYFGAVKLSKTGAALPLALLADAAGITAAIALAYKFY